MTRPPSVPGFAQFFPTAPKVRAEAEGRADRERSRSKPNGVDSSRDYPDLSDSQANGIVSSHGRISSDAPHAQSQARVDENESPPRDIPSTVDSASSYASAASSVFSARPGATSASSRYPTASVTPLASKDSPSSSITTAPSKGEMPPSALSDRAARHTSQASAITTVRNGFPSDEFSAVEPARDPVPSIKGLKCTFDPLLERLRNKGVSKTAKPTYKEFGMVRINNTLHPGLGRGGRHLLCVELMANSWTGR